MPWPCPAMADSVGTSWMEANALTCRVRIRASAASTATISAAGTITDTFSWSPMTRALVTEKTNTPTAKAKVRHTIGSSRNRVSRGDRLVKAHCTTRKSSEKITVTSPSTPKPTATSASVTWLLATVDSKVIRGSSRPSPSPARAHSSCTRPARRRRRGRPNRPEPAGSQRPHHRSRRWPRGNPARQAVPPVAFGRPARRHPGQHSSASSGSAPGRSWSLVIGHYLLLRAARRPGSGG